MSIYGGLSLNTFIKQLFGGSVTYNKFENINEDKINELMEIMYRRYQKALVEKTSLPDLIIVDGGEKQIVAAKEILDLLHANIFI